MSDPFKKQLNSVITEYEEARSKSQHSDASDVISNIQIIDLQTRCIAAIERIVGKRSIYYEQVVEISKKRNHVYNHVAEQIGVAKALLSDIENDYLRSFEEIIHGDLFADYLEMSTHLEQNGYKDAAAVLAGSTLEAHMRQLCNKHGVATVLGTKMKKADTLNAELVKAQAYTKSDQKSVTAWLGIRNSAAHGNYNEYTRDQVKLLIDSIRDFIRRNPA